MIVPVAVILDVVNELPRTCAVLLAELTTDREPPSRRTGERQGVLIGVQEGIQPAAAERELLRVAGSRRDATCWCPA